LKTPFESLITQTRTHRDPDSPPLHRWHPPFSGDIAIHIDSQGSWFHEGGKIERESLVRLFASILRREEDGHYYLVTPSEKWRIQVERHPLLVTDVEEVSVDGIPVLRATLNTGRQLLVSEQHPLFLDPAMGGIAALHLPHGLTALCTRPAWYRLVDLADNRNGTAMLRSFDFELRLSDF
jgi:uncharacterized protein